MDNRLNDLSRYRLQKARDELESSEIMLQNTKFSQSINRSYYAIFHAIRALLALDKFDARKHSGVIAYFNQHYIKTEKIETKFGKILILAENIRIKSDYDDFYIASKQQAEEQLSNAREFIERIETYINLLP
ncbi:MAG: HEPN domain-containing protein [Candidatus Eremiobacterota bacterium]